MHVVNDLSFLSLISGATIPVQLVMIILDRKSTRLNSSHRT